MHKRPKPGETEEDLLEFQKQFLAQKCAPSASVTTSKQVGEKRPHYGSSASTSARDVVHLEGFPKNPETSPSGPKKSRFKAAQEKAKTKSHMTGLQMQTDDFIDEHDRSSATVLTKIIERDTHNAMYTLPAATSLPFPAVSEVLADTTQTETMVAKKKKRSLFAQQFEVTSATADSADRSEATVAETDFSSDESLPNIIDGSGLSATFGRQEAHKIHEENIAKLTSMSPEEVLEEQAKLLSTLDPKLVAFLKSRRLAKERSASGEGERGIAPHVSPKTKQQVTEVKDVTVPVDVKKEWVHMDKVEYDKLEWMKDLPPPSTDNKAGQQARFDFNGNLVQADADIPVNLGLHHHGDEPERAGYTLEELFTLARSSNLQQRVLALNTLSRVIQQARQGNLKELVQTPILPSILDAGVIFLLRWSLDDGVESVMAASVAALNALLVNHADELAIGKAFHWYQGSRAACLTPAKPMDVGIKLPGETEEKPQQTDAELAKDDLVLALVSRMNLLHRLFYILKTMRPQAPTVIGILQILSRVCRHSTQLAYQVFNYKGLLELIIAEYLPVSWTPVGRDASLSQAYGVPLKDAMILVRTLCQAGRNMAAILLSKFGIRDRILRFLLADPESVDLPESEAHGIIMECLNTWAVCLTYGLADSVYLDCYGLIVDKLRRTDEVLNQPVGEQARVAALVSCLETAVCVATTPRKQHTFSHSHDGTSIAVERSEDVAMATITWSHVADLIYPIRIILFSSLQEVAGSYQIKKQSLQLPLACLNFVTTYFIHCQTQLHGADMINGLQMLEEIYRHIIQHWNSIGMTTILSRLSQHSNLVHPTYEMSIEQHSCLPDYGNSSVQEDQFLPTVRTGSPYGFLGAWYRLVYNFTKIHKGLQSPQIEETVNLTSPLTVIQSADLWVYLRKIATRKLGSLAHNYFTKFETLLLYHVLKLLALMVSDGSDLELPMAHHVSLKLLTFIHEGDEHLAHDLLSTVTFNPVFFRTDTSEEATSRLKDLSLSPSTHIHSATQEEMEIVTEQLVTEAQNSISSIRASYIAAFSRGEQKVLSSRHHYHGDTMATESCFTSNMGESVLPADWMFAPLIELYNTFCSVGTEVQNVLSHSQLDTVRNVLRWIYLIESRRTTLLEEVSVTLQLSRIMCVFLTGNDMFLDRTVHCYLAGLLRSYMSSNKQSKIDFSEHIPGLPSFYDLYVALLQQYEAVSFGDSLFACYILIALQQRHSIEYRKAIFTEYTGILRTMSLPLTELLLPLETYLEPEETNVELIRLYFQALYGGTLRPNWCPVLYLVAVHHVNRFMYTQGKAHRKLKESMLTSVIKCSNLVLKDHLMMYKHADVGREYGMELYSTLPPIRQQYIDSFKLA